MPMFKLPLSGDVAQTINPWTSMVQMFGGQFGLININLGKSRNPAVEQAILEDVGSYGRQIGRISEALEVVVRKLDSDTLSAADRKAIDDFTDMMAEVQKVKNRHTG
ncbi:hypothetical protein GCM10011316_10480 [Roseibium aquae]|uniref:Uncharacterized protein n=1 Tax=Roseibium aquae TaxID=1323746 RepID=A0A916TFA0_9HYPH|nr:hypothetical protein [Roseibium aquae]GGB40321.1 hypothetical protein GCM10011316_10480 [Roseibium aquae]